MSDFKPSHELISFAKYARERADWVDGEKRQACKSTTHFGTTKPPDHANCGGHRCGCLCHAPSDRDRELFTRLADEIETYLDESEPAQDDLFGEVS